MMSNVKSYEIFEHLPAAHACVSGLHAMPGGQCSHPGVMSSF